MAATYAEILPDTRAETPFDLGILDHFINEMPESANPVLEPSGLALFSFQSGSGERLIERGYGHDVSIHGVLHRTETIAALLTNAGFEIVATAERQPTAHERSCQGFVLARKL